MTIETRLKDYILTRYKSVREFTQRIDMANSTMDSILRRGVANSSITNIIKICEELHISTDELANGKIVPVYSDHKKGSTEILDILEETKNKLLHFDDLTLDGEPVSEEIIKSIIHSIDIGVEMSRRL